MPNTNLQGGLRRRWVVEVVQRIDVHHLHEDADHLVTEDIVPDPDLLTIDVAGRHLTGVPDRGHIRLGDNRDRRHPEDTHLEVQRQPGTKMVTRRRP